MRPSVLLLHPPVAKPAEPPAGVARLAGVLVHAGISCTTVDLNIECMLDLLNGRVVPADRWTHRACRNLHQNLAGIRNPETYRNFDRYHRSVMDLNRVFEKASPSPRVRLSLANYQQRELSPVRSSDLLRAAEAPEGNPFLPYFQQRLGELVASENPTVAGLSLNYLSQALCAFAILGLLRRDCPGLTLVLGGGLVTSWLRRPGWQNPFGGLVDHMIAGPGESALLELTGVQPSTTKHALPCYDFALNPGHRVLEPVEHPHIPVPPLAKEGQECPTLSTQHSAPGTQPPTPIARHSSLSTRNPQPATRHYPYLAPGFILPYSSSSGCYWNKCAFCPERAEGNPYVPRPVDRAVTELQGMVRKWNPILLHLLDNALSPQLLKALAEKPPGAPWYGFARITDHFADSDFCMALKQSGCAMLQLGIESGDQKVLDAEHKGIDLGIVSRALKNLHRVGIATYVYLLFGTPSETRTEARATLEFTAGHAARINFLNLAIFNLPIHGLETLNLKTRMHYDGDLSLYADFRHPGGWHRGLVRQFLDREFKRHPAIASILRRDPPIFTSNHAPFFANMR